MDNETNIVPGDVEGYSLGILPKEEFEKITKQASSNTAIKSEVDDFAIALEEYLMLNAVTPPAHLKNNILDALSNLKLEEALNPDQLPLINKYSDYKNWLKIVEPLLPGKIKGLYAKPIRNDDTVTQLLMCTDVDYPDEVHHDEEECFIMLKGKCKCYIGDESVILQAGDYLDIPLHLHHSVEVLEPVIAIVQRKKVA
jgi:mannose-6-phosphate isomerase-like protein (cupin superfamily)